MAQELDTPSSDIERLANPDLTGKWRLQSHNGIDEFLKCDGYNWMMRKIIANMGNELFIYHNRQNQHITIKSVNSTGHIEFVNKAKTNDTAIQYTDKVGYTIKSTFKWNADKTELIEQLTKEVNGKTSKYSKNRYIDQYGQLILVWKNGNGSSFSSVYIQKDITQKQLNEILCIDNIEHSDHKTNHNQIEQDEKKNNDIVYIDATEAKKEENHISQSMIGYEHKFEKLQTKINELKQENQTLHQQMENKNNDNNKCNVKFRNWLFNTVKMSQYLSLFEENKYNDIRMIEFLDEDILRNDIGINKKLHYKLILKKVEQFKVLQNEFDVLLNDKKELKKYQQEFEENGILTVKDLQNDIKSKNDLRRVIKIENENELSYIWDAIHISNVEGNITEYH